MSKALYRKYRSKSLDEIVGQDHITSILARAVKTGRISHAYLLTGPRGVGKTSVARILAHEINHLPYSEESSHLDIIEIDAASNNGVEDVRDLRDKVQIAPVSADKKIYIIDEVHMLSKPAFNALLKTLEEPPEHVVFILATTDIDKLPATIISRTQRFSFRSIGRDDAMKQLRFIADTEKIAIDDESLAVIADRGDGSFRDSISLLDQLSSLVDSKDTITLSLVEASLGLAPNSMIDDLLQAVEDKSAPRLVEVLDTAYGQGISPVVIADQLARKIRELAADKPSLFTLLDALLDVSRSSHPDLKLLSALGSMVIAKQAPKVAALATPVLEVSATIEELSKKATQVKPKEAKIELPEKPVTPVELSTTTSKEPVGPTDPRDFDDKALIEYTRINHVALFSVLSKCAFRLDGSDLTVYTNNAFYKKKLDDAKYSALLYKSLEALGVFQLTVHIVATPPPPTSSQAAAVAVIMGGGEELDLDTV